jgi:hypothetical protein
VADYANDAGTKQGAFSILQPADADSFKVEGANIWMWTDRAFSSQSLPDMRKGITLTGDRLQNGTPIDLRGAVWVQNRQVRALGTLKSGDSASIPANASETITDVDLTGAVLRASQLDKIFDDATLSNGIHQRALEAALGSNFGRQDGGALLVAWATEPVAPISIGETGARAKNMSLIVLRVPPSMLTNSRVAAREAAVRRVNFEAKSGTNGGGTACYECLLPPTKNWLLTARGRGATPYVPPLQTPPVPGGPPGSPPIAIAPPPPPAPKSIARGKLPVWVHFEALNASQNRWIPLVGQLRQDKSPDQGWNFSAPVSGDFPRQPDRMLRVRVRLDNGRAKISSLHITGGSQ